MREKGIDVKMYPEAGPLQIMHCSGTLAARTFRDSDQRRGNSVEIQWKSHWLCCSGVYNSDWLHVRSMSRISMLEKRKQYRKRSHQPDTKGSSLVKDRVLLSPQRRDAFLYGPLSSHLHIRMNCSQLSPASCALVNIIVIVCYSRKMEYVQSQTWIICSHLKSTWVAYDAFLAPISPHLNV